LINVIVMDAKMLKSLCMEQEENIPEVDKETHRLAVVNMDWSQVKVSFGA
jgi:hypothetical protein